MSQPWMKFYPSDWRADPALRSCSMPARGLWMEMICLMHEAAPRGSLVINGQQVTAKQLASLCGTGLAETRRWLGELAAAGVFSSESDGTIFSRRIRRDEEKAEKDKANGKGGGNPKLKAGVNPPDKAQKPEARSQSSDDAEDASARAPLIRPEAFELSEEIAKLCGHDPHFVPTAWCGAPFRVEMWLTQGWTRDQVIPAVTSALAKKHGKAPVSIQYFEKPIAEFIAQMSRPLPEVVVDNTAEKIHVRPPTTSAIIAAADRLVERLASFDEPAPSDLRGGEGAQPIRAISKG